MSVLRPLSSFARGLRALALAALCSAAPLAQGDSRSGAEPAPKPRIEFPLAPRFVPARNDLGFPMIVKAEDLEREVRSHSPNLLYFWAPHQTHVVLDGDWLARMLEWYGDLLARFGVNYVAETWDCENYAQFLVSLVALEMVKYWRADVRAPVGWITVLQEVPWGGVAAGVRHALVIVRTQHGMEIVEPQNGRRTPLAAYPNRHRILEVYFQ